MNGSVRPRAPSAITLAGVRPVRRVIHEDPRGTLVETLRIDDPGGERFAMAYTSVTRPGEFRDRDRWHVHRVQSDRFIVPVGEMTLALLDGRPGSTTEGQLEVIRMVGSPYRPRAGGGRSELETYLVPIPPGVLHCIGNLSDAPFVLVNSPTELYDPADEGRVPFPERIIPALGRPFTWEIVQQTPGAVGGA